MTTTDKAFGDKDWKRLDNMANIFPAIEIFFAAPVYRVELTFKKEIDPEKLLKAATITLNRFPYYKVKLGKGFFWAYLEQNKKDIIIHDDTLYPCLGINYRANNGFLFKIKYHGATLALEIFHALTDGGGAMILLNTMAAEYLKQTGIEILPNKAYGIWDTSSKVESSEYEDSFYNYFDKNQKSLGLKSSAYHFEGTKEKSYIVHYIKAYTDGKKLSALSKKYNLSVTGFLSAVYIYSLYQTQQSVKKEKIRKKPIRLSVPMNLRKIFSSNTMRNFTYFSLCEIYPANKIYTFNDIADTVREALKFGINQEEIIKNFSGNVNSERNILIRILPLFLKLVMLSLIYKKSGENQYSGSFSNLGVVNLPPEMKEHILEYTCFLAPNSLNTTNCGAVTFDNKAVITFTRLIKETAIEQYFFNFLTEQGLEITLDSNYGQKI